MDVENYTKQELINKLAESEVRFQQIAEIISDIFFLLDLKTGRLLYVSPSFEKIWGGSMAELRNTPSFWLTRIHPEDKDKFEALYAKQIQTGVLDIEFRIIQLNGIQRWVHVKTCPVYNKQGALYRCTGIVEDISERMLLVQERLNHINALYHSHKGLVISLAKAQESKDAYTARHQHNVAIIATAIAKELGLPEDTIKGVELAAHVHDIGKIGIPAELLTKPIALTTLEFELIKTHPSIGFEILKANNFPWPIAQIVLQHHERINGSGYPQKLSRNEILIEAKIIAVADSLDAMALHRPYRPAKGLKDAFSELLNNKDVLYDAEIVYKCIHLFDSNQLSLYDPIKKNSTHI